MRESRMNKQRRRQAFSRRLREKKAVSPVVATLILILIAVAAAAALYLWLVAWQGGVTKTVGTPSPQYTVSIGGSTTVYPLDVIAVNWFEQNNSGVTIADQQGGSASGVTAVCAGAIDIGASSTLESSSALSGYGCPATVVQTPIGYDGVDVIYDNGSGIWGTSDLADHYLADTYYADTFPTFNQSTLTAIYECNGNGTSFGNSGAAYALPAWENADNAAGGTLGPTVHTGSTSADCGGYQFSWSDIGFPAGCSPAGDNGVECIHDDGADAGKLIQIYHRADNSGTEQSFVQLLLGPSGGCGTDKGNELSECGITATGEVGNPALLSAVIANPNGIGFNSNGIVYEAKDQADIAAFEGPSQTVPIVPTATNILAGVSANCGLGTSTACTNTQYYGWRQLEYVTVGSPTGESSRFITFVVGSEVNQDLALATGYISIYAPGAPPPVPVVD